jgi:hypothetical protein
VEELIRQAFLHVDIIGPHVTDGHYDLIAPNGEIILPQVWESIIQPGWSITMHMWPMPEPPNPIRPTQSFAPPSHHFPPTPAHSGHRYSDHFREIPPRPPPSGSRPKPGYPTRHVRADSPHMPKDPKLAAPEKSTIIRDLTESRPVKGSWKSDTSSSEDYVDHYAALHILSKFMRVRRVFMVGKMGYGNGRENHFRLSPKKEALLLLNEYGRKLVDVTMKHDIEA